MSLLTIAIMYVLEEDQLTTKFGLLAAAINWITGVIIATMIASIVAHGMDIITENTTNIPSVQYATESTS